MCIRDSVAPLLEPFRRMPAVDRPALDSVLQRVSEMACELPWIRKMEINPLIIDDQGAIAVDARISIITHVTSSEPYGHMAICPYPAYLDVYKRQYQYPLHSRLYGEPA